MDEILTTSDGGALVPTVAGVLLYARSLEKNDPDFLAQVIATQTDEDYHERDLIERVARLIEIFGIIGAAQIVGCC
jgi:hypothetical protein